MLKGQPFESALPRIKIQNEREKRTAYRTVWPTTVSEDRQSLKKGGKTKFSIIYKFNIVLIISIIII